MEFGFPRQGPRAGVRFQGLKSGSREGVPGALRFGVGVFLGFPGPNPMFFQVPQAQNLLRGGKSGQELPESGTRPPKSDHEQGKSAPQPSQSGP